VAGTLLLDRLPTTDASRVFRAMPYAYRRCRRRFLQSSPNGKGRDKVGPPSIACRAPLFGPPHNISVPEPCHSPSHRASQGVRRLGLHEETVRIETGKCWTPARPKQGRARRHVGSLRRPSRGQGLSRGAPGPSWARHQPEQLFRPAVAASIPGDGARRGNMKITLTPSNEVDAEIDSSRRGPP